MTSADNYVGRRGIRVARTLDNFVENEELPPLGIDPHVFWSGFAEIVATFGPRNIALFEHRAVLQDQLVGSSIAFNPRGLRVADPTVTF
jgi:malate synthase